MTSTANMMFTLIDGASGAGSVSCRPRTELAQRATDATSGV
ncbi:MAG TPA: hypothetical protein VG474_12450 [Solirubrobacteraceae bacterium]|nr:hypothetical protein [Solirubrobacteraceae bacterium]